LKEKMSYYNMKVVWNADLVLLAPNGNIQKVKKE
jgi:hypothetical protein